MSRSRRKIPITKNGRHGSDKESKRRCNRTFRRKYNRVESEKAANSEGDHCVVHSDHDRVQFKNCDIWTFSSDGVKMHLQDSKDWDKKQLRK